jgi:hypothetical protein
VITSTEKQQQLPQLASPLAHKTWKGSTFGTEAFFKGDDTYVKYVIPVISLCLLNPCMHSSP